MSLQFTSSIVVATLALMLAGFAWKLNSKALLNQLVTATAMLATFRVFTAALVNTAGEDSFWLLLRLSQTGSLIVLPLSFSVNLVFSGISRFWRWALLGPLLAVALVELVPLWTGEWIVSGYHTEAVGNVLHPALNPLWSLLYFGTGEFACFLSLGSFVWAYRKTKSRRHRGILVQLFVVVAVVNLVGLVLTSAQWKSWGYTDPTVLFAGVHAINYFLLISRYQALMDDKTRFGGDLFQSLQDPVLLANGEGKIVQASERMLRLLGKPERELRGQSVFTVLTGWQQLETSWKTLTRDQLPQTGLTGSLADGQFLLSLSPSRNKFGDLEGVLVTVKHVDNLDATVQRFGISDREREVADLLLDGQGTQEIADTLCISPATVKNHIAKLFQKTGTKNRVELVKVLKD